MGHLQIMKSTRQCCWSKHGKSQTRVYKIWCKMKERCSNPKDIGFKDYGGRGVTVCDAWRTSFPQFLADMGNPPTKHHSIDRINNALGYSKDNCKWSDGLEQGRNKRNNVILACGGKSQTLSDWSREIKISVGTLWMRIKRGWNDARIVTTPLRQTIFRNSAEIQQPTTPTAL
jgi:hypothetical protein